MNAEAQSTLNIECASELATVDLGAALARSAPRAASHALVVYLQGELGSGKTTLARALLRALGEQGTVRSPSYTLIESYELPDWQVLHLDLYRLRAAAELEHLALRDELRGGVLLLIEWPERAERDLPEADLRILLSLPVSAESQVRRVVLQAATPMGRHWLSQFELTAVVR